MKKLFLAIAIAIMSLSAGASPKHQSPQAFADYVSKVSQIASQPQKSWRKGNVQTPTMSPQHVVTSTETSIGPVSTWGPLYTPAGEEWMYTANFTYETVGEWMETITHADFTIYDSNYEVYRQFSADFQLREGETTINSVQVSSTLTRKFFNINDAYEVMVYVHATTEDYAGSNYTQVYSLTNDECTLVTTIEGMHIGSIDTAADPWGENFTLLFMREDIIYPDEDNSTSSSDTTTEDEDMPGMPVYMLYFDVYSKAGWSTGAQLEHTFDVDYNLVSGSGNAALPILINQHNHEVYYALPRYEKPYFVNSWSDDITPDNNFIIDLYDKNFNLVNTTVIPIELENDAIFSFPGIGELYGNNDMFFDENGIAGYVVGVENYIASTDDFLTSLYYYDAQGNRLKTYVENATDYLRLSEVPNNPDQWCFYFPAEDGGYFSMIDFPSGEEKARINVVLDGEYLSFSIDRVAYGPTYKYVSSVSTADVNAANEVIHKFAWFNDNGSFDKYHRINLGKKIALAMAYVNAEAFNPYLFNTDSNIEYMFIVKKYVTDESSRSEELLRIYSDNNDLILELGPDKVTGEVLNSIFLANPATNEAKLVVAYYGNDNYTIRPIDLPLTKFAGGDGSAANPYLIASPGDLMSMYLYPEANYRLAKDIDCEFTPFQGNRCNFSGTLDGAGYTISNLSLTDNGIFTMASESAVIKDLKLRNVVCTLKSNPSMGVIADETSSNKTVGVQLTNISINGLTATGSGSGSFGGIIGSAPLHTYVTECAVVNADIELPRAEAGGIAGVLKTGSVVSGCYFEGSVTASDAGGIAGGSFTGDETIENCHVKANISGNETAGGIIGSSSRTFVFTTFAEGTVNAYGARWAYAGGIAGYVKSTYEKDPPIMIQNCISAAQVSVNPVAERGIAHRIAGLTSGEELLVDWDSKDPNVKWDDPSTYPYINGSPETCMKSNYALDADVIDAEMGANADGPEGESITVADLTDAFFTEHDWKFGDTLSAPWQLQEGLPVLFFERDSFLGATSIAIPRTDIKVEGNKVVCPNQKIDIYTTSGMLIATGYSEVSISNLHRGIYVARTAKGSVKFAK